MNQTPVIEMIDIVKTFPGVKALDNMSVDLFPGEIHCLVGENGAGKSTLMKILSGAYRPDSGKIIINEKEYNHMTAALSRELGINIIYQENLLVPWMNIVENIFIGQEITKNGFVDFNKEFEISKELCDSIHLNLNLNKTVDKLSVAEQQYVKIIKALSTKPKVLIMDEPTSMFNVEDAGKVLEMVEHIAKNGVSVLYISHFLKEVKQIADRITVIRDGSPIRTYDNSKKDVDLDRVVSDMVGREASMFYEKEYHAIGERAFEVVDLKISPDAEPVSFYIKRGEILGMAGMVGSGRTEIANAIVGASRKYGGKIVYNGKELNINSPVDSVQYGIGYITEDRQHRGLMLGAPIAENLAVVGLQTKIKGAFLNVRNIIPMLKGVIEGLQIKMASPMQEVKNLSGGNQQKVVLGKWLFTDCDVFIFDEPTRGIDVNAKSEFYKIMTRLASEGKSILMISSDMPELISMSDRVAVIRKGAITAILEKDQITENSIIRHALEVKEDEKAG
jgi:ABC-type sugar transport system ATPase subunit